MLLSARRVGPEGKAYGLDMTDEMLALARENQRKAGATNVEFLQGQRQGQARAMLVDELRNKTANVRVLLDPPRVEVAVAATDPVRGEPTAPVTLVEFSDYQ